MSSEPVAPTSGEDAQEQKGPDPRHLPNSWRPGVVHLQDREEPLFCANACPTEKGWLRIRGWAGSIARVPRERVLAVHDVEVERTSHRNTSTLGITDDKLVAQANAVRSDEPDMDDGVSFR